MDSTYEMDIVVAHPMRTMTSELRHEHTADATTSTWQWKWDATNDHNRKLIVTNLVTPHSHLFKVASPLMTSDVALACEWQVLEAGVLFASRHTLTYSDDPLNDLVLAMKLSDENEGRYHSHNYTAHFELTHKVLLNA